MLVTFLVSLNINLLKMIPSNSNISFGNFRHDIVESNIGKYGI